MFTLAKPCLENGLAGMDSAGLDSIVSYVQGYYECQWEAASGATKNEQQRKFDSCLKTGPTKPEQDGITVSVQYKKNHFINVDILHVVIC